MKPIVLINGKKLSKLSVFDRNTQFGDGLFETMLITNGKVEFWQKHYQRLELGRKRLKISKVKSKIWINDIAKAYSLSKLDNAVVKIILTRGESSRGYSFDNSIKANRIVIISQLPSVIDEYKLSTCSSGYSTNKQLANIKHCNRLEQILARIDLSTDECLMLDDNGYVISASQANIFCIKNDTLVTPALDECGIAGTMRESVIEIAKSLDMNVEIIPLTMRGLLDADEVFITNSIIGIKKVSSIDSTRFNQFKNTNNIIKKLNQIKDLQAKMLRVQKHHFRKFFLLLVFITIALLYYLGGVNVDKGKVYQVKPGATIGSVVNDLEELGYIRSSIYAKNLAKICNFEQIKQGFYAVEPNMRLYKLLKNISKAKVERRNIALIEGRTVGEYFEQIKHNDAIDSNSSLNEVMDSIGITPPYDGKLWPDTYQVNYGDSIASVFTRANKILLDKLDTAWNSRDKNNPIKNKTDALILASLVEKETAHNSEKAKIAGVFLSRLDKRMRLQTDPSVIYALGDKYDGSLSKSDLRFDSPYNTYRNKGLPPSAIGSVGEDSLQAVMHPQITGDLYFVSKKDGTHAFAKTYKQHIHNINKYLKNL